MKGAQLMILLITFYEVPTGHLLFSHLISHSANTVTL